MYQSKRGPLFGKHSKITLSIIIIATSLLAIGCVQKEPAQLSKEKEAAIADTIRTFIKNVNSAWENLEPGPYMDYFSQDASFVYQGSMLSRDQLENLVEKYMMGIQQARINMQDAKVNVINADAAVINFSYEQTMVRSSGDTTQAAAVISSMVARKNGKWKIVHAHETVNSN